VPAKADVTYVGEYKPTTYGFKGYQKGLKPAEHRADTQSPPMSNKPAAATSSSTRTTTSRSSANVTRTGCSTSGISRTLVHAKFLTTQPDFRNLAVAGDEINWRHRSENFGTPDDWLTRTKADVVFAFFGFNESFKGEAGLAAFKRSWTVAEGHAGEELQRQGLAARRAVRTNGGERSTAIRTSPTRPR
jgi:hypothetical protein